MQDAHNDDLFTARKVIDGLAFTEHHSQIICEFSS